MCVCVCALLHIYLREDLKREDTFWTIRMFIHWTLDIKLWQSVGFGRQSCASELRLWTNSFTKCFWAHVAISSVSLYMQMNVSDEVKHYKRLSTVFNEHVKLDQRSVTLCFVKVSHWVPVAHMHAPWYDLWPSSAGWVWCACWHLVPREQVISNALSTAVDVPVYSGKKKKETERERSLNVTNCFHVRYPKQVCDQLKEKG